MNLDSKLILIISIIMSVVFCINAAKVGLLLVTIVACVLTTITMYLVFGGYYDVKDFIKIMKGERR